MSNVIDLASPDFMDVTQSMLSRLSDGDRLASFGRVTRVVGLVLEASGLEVGLGARTKRADTTVEAVQGASASASVIMVHM